MFLIGARSTTSAAFTCAIAFPTSTRRVSPVAVVTTGVSVTDAAWALKSAVTVPPAVTATARDCSW